MKIRSFLWSAFIIALISLPQAAVLKAETLTDSVENGSIFNSVLLFCTVLTGISLLGICLAAIFKRR